MVLHQCWGTWLAVSQQNCIGPFEATASFISAGLTLQYSIRQDLLIGGDSAKCMKAGGGLCLDMFSDIG